MDFRLLGQLEVCIGDTVIEFTSSRQRKLIALLLFSRGQVVPVSRIIEALWDSEPPVTAKGQIQTCVSTLRRQFRELGAADLLSTATVGYAIQVPDESFDVAKFERLLSQGSACSSDGRPEDAAQCFRSALALWRGPAAANVEGRLLQAIASRLNEDRIRILEECIDLELSLGHHHRLVGELSELVSSYPLREHLRAQHMLALYRSARQADALESFQDARRMLMGELGLQPGEELCALQQAILAQDSTLDVPREAARPLASPANSRRVVPRQLPVAVADFTGRQELLAEIIGMLTDPPVQDGSRCLPIVCLNGEGGVGKTALAVQAAHAVQRAYPDGQLFVQTQGADGRPVDPMELLVRLISSLGRSPKSLPEHLPERIGVYRSWISGRRIVIILDNLASVDQATALIPGTPDCAVIITSHNPLPSLPGARHFKVGALDEDSGVELLGKIVGLARTAAEPEAVLQLVRFCDCLPLALRIVAAKLATRPHWTIGQMAQRLRDEPTRLNELAIDGIGIRATLTDSYTELSPRSRQLLVRLSLLGSADFGSWVCAPLLDEDFRSASDTLDELVDAGLVEVRVGDAGTSRLRIHDLVRIYALERLAAEERPQSRAATLQRLLSCWLSLATDAHRRAYGADFGLHGTADAWVLPDYVRDQLLARPMEWFRQERAGLVLAVTLAAQIGLDEVCWDIAVTMVTLLEADYLVEDWQKTHELALEVTRKAGNARGEAALLCSLGNLALIDRPMEAHLYLEPALRTFEELGDVHGRALALSGLAFWDRMGGRYERSLERYRQARADFQAVAEEIGELDALGNMAQIEMDWENYGRARQLLDEASARCRTLTTSRIFAQLQHRVAELHLRTGDLLGAEQALNSVLEIVRANGDLIGEAHALAGLGAVRLRLRRYYAAAADLSAALDISRRMDSNLIRGRVLLSLAELSLARADREGAAAHIGEGLITFSETGPMPVMRARFLELKAQIDDLVGNPMTADAARHEALKLVGDADTALSRALTAAVTASHARQAPELGKH